MKLMTMTKNSERNESAASSSSLGLGVFENICTKQDGTLCNFWLPGQRKVPQVCLVFLKKISLLEDKIIIFENRFDGQPNLNDIKVDCMISVDCTDCEVYKPQPFDKGMY